MKKTIYVLSIVVLTLFATKVQSQAYYYLVRADNNKVSALQISDIHIEYNNTQAGYTGSEAPNNDATDLPGLDLGPSQTSIIAANGYNHLGSTYHPLVLRVTSASYVNVYNWGATAQTVTVKTAIGGSSTSGSPVSVPAGQTVQVAIPAYAHTFLTTYAIDGLTGTYPEYIEISVN